MDYIIQQKNGRLVSWGDDTDDVVIWKENNYADCLASFDNKTDERILELHYMEFPKETSVTVCTHTDKRVLGTFHHEARNGKDDEWLQYRLKEWWEPFANMMEKDKQCHKDHDHMC